MNDNLNSDASRHGVHHVPLAGLDFAQARPDLLDAQQAHLWCTHRLLPDVVFGPTHSECPEPQALYPLVDVADEIGKGRDYQTDAEFQ